MTDNMIKYDSGIIGLVENNLLDLQNFQKQLHKEPNKNELRVNEQAKNSKYLPISFMEMTMDEMFFGLWSTKNFNTKVVTNEIVGELEVWYFHPVAKTWICRIGAGAVMIMQKSGSDITDLGAKIKNTLTKDYPHLKAECFRNACLSIGKAFGRDLNREFDDQYRPIIQEPSNEAEEENLKIRLKEFSERKELVNKSLALVDEFMQKGVSEEVAKSLIRARTGELK